MKKVKWFSALVLMVMLLASLCLFGACNGNKNNEKGKLSAPQNIKYDGATITWDTVAGAQKYSVKVNENEMMSTIAAAFPYRNSSNTAFTVTVTAKAEGKEDSPTASHQFIPLQKVEKIDVSKEGVLSWEPVEFATGYMVSVDDKQSEIYEASFKDFDVGSHTFKVKPFATLEAEGSSYYSSWSESKTLTILGDVDKDKISYSLQKGKITWSAVPNATSYHVVISGGAAPVDTTVNTTSYDYKADLADFAVSIQALGNYTTVFDSKKVVEKKFVYLPSARNLRFIDGALQWDEVSGAAGYKVKVNSVEKNDVIKECKYNGNFAANTSYTLSVMPVSEDSVYFTSWSEEFNFRILPAPVIKWTGNAADGEVMENVIWNGVSSATGYEVTVTYKNEKGETNTVIDLKGELDRSYGHAYEKVGEYTIAVKSLAPKDTSNIYDSVNSNIIKVTRLDAPEFVDGQYIESIVENVQNGFTAKFKPVTGASGYRIYKDGLVYTTIQNSNFHETKVVDLSVIEEQNITYKIQSVGRTQTQSNGVTTVVLDSLSATARSFSVKILAAPTGQDISGYTYSYNQVSGANGYMVNIDNTPKKHDSTECPLAELVPGSHTVRVCSRGNGAEILSSNYTPAISIRRLAAPVDVRISTEDASEGMLKFTPVDGAQSYSVTIEGTKQPVPVEEFGNINQYFAGGTNGITIHMQSNANMFNELKTIYTMTSPSSDTLSLLKLKAPTNLAFVGQELRWNNPNNVDEKVFTPTYQVYDDHDILQNGEKNGTMMSIAGFEGGRSYTFKVKAIGKEESINGVQYINSECSDTITAYKLDSPYVQRVDGSYQWEPVVNAVSYAVYIDGKLSLTEYHLSGNMYNYVPKFDDIKMYKVQIYAIGDGGITTIDSSACEILQETKQLQTPDFAFSYSKEAYEKDGEIVINITKPSPYARGYNYSVGGAQKVAYEETYRFNPNGAGSFVLGVYACGGNFDESGVYYLDSQSCGSNSRYTIHILTAPTQNSINVTADGYVTWGAINAATAYELTFTINGVAYEMKTVTAIGFTINLKNIGIAYKDVKSLVVEIRAIGGSNTVKSEKVSREWTNLH